MSDFLITNENDNTLYDRLKKFINAHNVKYFFYHGGYFSSGPLIKLSDEFEKFHQIIILIGENTFPDVIKIIKNDNLSQEESKIRNWYLSGKLIVKVSTSQGHSKDYIIQYEDQRYSDTFIAYSGSANFTSTGFGYSGKSESTWEKENKNEINALYLNYLSRIKESVDIKTALKEKILCNKCGGRIVNGKCKECRKNKKSKKTKYKYHIEGYKKPVSLQVSAISTENSPQTPTIQTNTESLQISPITAENPNVHVAKYKPIETGRQVNHKRKKKFSFKKVAAITVIFIFIYAVFHYFVFHKTGAIKTYNTAIIPNKISQNRIIKNKPVYENKNIKSANYISPHAIPINQFSESFRNAKPTITLIAATNEKNIKYAIFSHLYSFAGNIRRRGTEIFRLKFTAIIPSDPKKIEILSKISGNGISDINISYVKLNLSGRYSLSLPVKIPNNFRTGQYNFSYIINGLMYSRYAHFKVE